MIKFLQCGQKERTLRYELTHIVRSRIQCASSGTVVDRPKNHYTMYMPNRVVLFIMYLLLFM